MEPCANEGSPAAKDIDKSASDAPADGKPSLSFGPGINFDITTMKETQDSNNPGNLEDHSGLETAAAVVAAPPEEVPKVKRDKVLLTPPVAEDTNSVLNNMRTNNVTRVTLGGVSIVALTIDGKERLCLAQISNTLLKEYSYNEIHNRRVALGITCVQCTPVQLEILRRAGAMPASSRRCGMITRREAERLVKSFLEDNAPPQLPEDFAFAVKHECGWGCHGQFIPSRYNSSRAKCIKCSYCNMYFSPNKFIFHYHRTADSSYRHPDAANFNSWRRHLYLSDPNALDELVHAWEDVKAMFNGGIRKRVHVSSGSQQSQRSRSPHSPEKRPKVEQKSPPCSQPSFSRETSYPKYKCPIGGPPADFFSPKARMTFPMSPTYQVGIPEEQAKAIPGPGGTWSPSREALYHPPYEMIWARHLGLTAPESSFALGPDQLNCKSPVFASEDRCPGQIRIQTSPRKDTGPVALKENNTEPRMTHHHEASGFKLYRPFDNVIEKSHLSAFKPVITGSSLTPIVPIDFSIRKEDTERKEGKNRMFSDKEDARDKNAESESEDEVLDVDTVDEPINLSETASASVSRPTEQQSVIKTIAKHGQSIEPTKTTVTAALDEKITQLLDETTRNIRTKMQSERETDALNNNTSETSTDEVKEPREIEGIRLCFCFQILTRPHLSFLCVVKEKKIMVGFGPHFVCAFRVHANVRSEIQAGKNQQCS